MRSTPRYRQVFDSLVSDIQSGRAVPGQKLPSEAALVRKFGTSRITIGRALRDLQSAGLIERRAGSGSYVSAESRPAMPLTFGLLIPDLGVTEIFDPICRGLASAPKTATHALLWGQIDPGDQSKEEQAWRLCQQFISRRVSGVFFAPLEFETGAEKSNRRVLAALRDAGIPAVLLDRRPASKPVTDRTDLVGLNNRHAGYIATEHLIQLGCKRIGFLAHSGAVSSISARLAGHRDALHDYGLRDDLGQVMESAPLPAGRLAGEIEAFVCVNDAVAATLMGAFLMHGTRIPEDVRIVGIDDIPYARLLPVPLTTVRQPCQEIGEAAMRAMLERIHHPKMPVREILLEGELVVRQSSGAHTN